MQPVLLGRGWQRGDRLVFARVDLLGPTYVQRAPGRFLRYATGFRSVRATIQLDRVHRPIVNVSLLAIDHAA